MKKYDFDNIIDPPEINEERNKKNDNKSNFEKKTLIDSFNDKNSNKSDNFSTIGNLFNHAGWLVGLIAVLIAIVMVLSLKSCSKSDNGTSQTNYISSEVNGQEDGYVFPNSDSRYLTISDLEDLSPEQLRIGRNEIYARLGRRFNDTDLQKYFDNCSWYEGTIAADDFDYDILNDYERTNAFFILDYEEQCGYSE